MINWNQISGFDWDDGNSRKSIKKHGVGQSEAEQVFFNNPLIVQMDIKHSQSEPRFHALGLTDGERPLHLTFTLRRNSTLLRIISVRDMHRKERGIYEQAKKNP